MPHYRFGVFELDSLTGELRRKGMRIRLHQQPLQLLLLFIETPGALITRDQITATLWPDGTFVDYEHGVNSALNRLREALGDSARNPRFVETLARRGYRFLAPVEVVATQPEVTSDPAPSEPEPKPAFFETILATPADLPASHHQTARTLYLLLQLLYLGFYIGTLANLPEINELLSPLPQATEIFLTLLLLAAVLIPPRLFLVSAILFRPPNIQSKLLTLWRWLLPMDLLWSLSPFLLLHHIPYGLALACSAILLYSPFAQRSLILMGATAK